MKFMTNLTKKTYVDQKCLKREKSEFVAMRKKKF